MNRQAEELLKGPGLTVRHRRGFDVLSGRAYRAIGLVHKALCYLENPGDDLLKRCPGVDLVVRDLP